MTEVAVATRAEHLRSGHSKAAVGSFDYCRRGNLVAETGPTATRIKLGVGVEERIPASNAAVLARLPVLFVFARVGPLCSVLAQYPKRLRFEYFPPFIFTHILLDYRIRFFLNVRRLSRAAGHEEEQVHPDTDVIFM